MEFEKEVITTKNANEARLYPERMFLRADKEITRLKAIENGEVEVLKLSEEERKDVLNFESILGGELKSIDEIKINSIVFYPEYFLTEEGRMEFKNITGLDVEGDDVEDVKKLILNSRNVFNGIDGKELSKLQGKAKTFSEANLINTLKQRTIEDGELDIENVQNPARIYVVLNPADALEKIKRLRNFKGEVALKDANPHGNSESISAVEYAKEKIKDLYRKKTNTMIASEAHLSAWAFQVAEYLGKETLTEDEKNLGSMFGGMQAFEKTWSRYDRFIHGTDKEYDEQGMRHQISRELEIYIAAIEKEYENGELGREQRIIEKGLDPVKLKEKSINCDTFSHWAEGLLEDYGQKSSYSAEDYDPKRKGAAPDGKWQFVAREKYKSMSVNSKQKIIKSGTSNKTITETLGTLLGHEFTHFIQALNQEKMPLKLFGDIGGDRAVVFSEGGAMMVQDVVSKDLFGFEKKPHPHYIKAMKKRLEGGTYLECAKAFYDSELRILQKKKNAGVISDKQFNESLEYWLEMALDRAKRLFHPNEKFDSTEAYLTKSKDTVYAEQAIIMEKLRKNGMEKYAFVRGINLNALATIAEIGLLNLAEIQKPNLEPLRKIWEQEKDKYLLEQKEPTYEEKLVEVRKAIETLDSSLASDKS